MKLGANESLVAQEGASLFKDFIAVGGLLTLTNKRLIFRSASRWSRDVSLEISVDKIAEIEYFKTLNISPNGIMLMLKDGSVENFVVDDRMSWRSRILQCLGHKS